MSNAPHFDPLNANADEEAEMVRGYREAGDIAATMGLETTAYEHGWRMRRNDMACVVDADQRELARRISEIRADAEQRRNRIRSALRGPTRRFSL